MGHEHVAQRRGEGGDETVEEATIARPVGALLLESLCYANLREALVDYPEKK